MATKYTYSLTSDFGGNITSDQLVSEIEADAGVTPTCTYINTDDDVVDIWFDAGLSGGEITIVDGLVSSHVAATPPKLKVKAGNGAAYGTTATLKSAQSGNRTIFLPDADDTLVGRDMSMTLTNKKLVTANTEIVDNGDVTKIIKFDASTATTSTSVTLRTSQSGNRIITLPDADDTLVGLAVTQTISNKDLMDSSISFVDNIDTSKKLDFQLSGASTGSIVTLASNHTANRVITLPDVTGTLLAATASQTVTNKTINADSNTISNIDDADIKAAAAIDATKIADGSVTNAEFQYINSVTSNVQTQLNGKATSSHTHATGDITSGTFADARIAASNVTQHQAALSVTESQISDFGSYSVTSHTHVASDVTDFATAADARITLQAGATNGLATLNGAGKVPAGQLDLDSVDYQGTWNADTNTPTLVAGTGTKGYYYVVSVAGATNIDGETDWKTGDWIIFNGTVWEKSDHTDQVTSVAGKQGAVTLATGDIASGTFVDARIAASNVTQHEAAITHQNLSGAGTNTHAQIDTHIADGTLHRIINDAGTSATELWSASKISGDLAGKAASSHTHATSDITSGTFADARIAASNVTQHQAALSVTESQISDLQSYLVSVATNDISDVSNVTPVDKHVLVYDGVTDNRYENRLLVEADISDLGSYATSSHTHATGDITSGTFADARIAASNVTQHQAALSITESQISDLTHTTSAADLTSGVLADARIAASNVTQHEGSITHQNLSGAGTNTHAQIDTHISSSSNPHSVTKAQVNLGNVPDLKVNLVATVAPTATDDSGSGYAVGSRWIDVTADKEYVCVDASATAAVWTETTSSGGGDVTAAASIPDNAIVRGDGGAKGVQDSGGWLIDDDGLMHNTSISRSGYAMEVWNTKAIGGGNGLHVRGGEVAGDIAIRIADADDTFTLWEVEANDGYTSMGKTYAATLADNGVVYGLDLQYGTGSAADINTQSGIYRIGGVDVTAVAQTLTNKTINADNNTISNIDNADIKAAAAIDATKIADGTVTNTEFQYIGTLSSNAQTQLNGKAASSHTHAASDITSGTLGVARGGTGGVTFTQDGWLMGNGTGAVTAIKNNMNASVAPAAGTDDVSLGYAVGSRWFDTTADKEYVCLDATDGAAVWTETTGAGGGGPADMIAVQARRTTAYTLTAGYVDITFDATDVENDTAVIEHDNTNTDRITVKETGLYVISYDFDIDATATSNSTLVDAQVRANDTTVLNGSHARISTFNDSSIPGSLVPQHICNKFIVSLTANDYLSLQMMYTTAAADTGVNGIFTVYRLKGAPGPQGPEGPAGNSKTIRQGHSWCISGELKVPSGDTDFLCPFYISLASGQTANIVSCRHIINSGTSATVKVTKNDVDVTGFTGISVTGTATTTNPADVALAENDKLALVVTGVSGTPTNLSFTLFVEHTV